MSHGVMDRPGLAPVALSHLIPTPTHLQKESTALFSKCGKIKSFHSTFICSSSTGGGSSSGKGKNQLVSEQQKTWNSLKEFSLFCVFCFYFLGDSGVRSKKVKTSTPPSLEALRKRNSPEPYFFVPAGLFFLHFKTCSGSRRGRSSSRCSSVGSSAPSRSSRRCPASSGAGAWVEDSGSICRSGWSGRSC